MSARSALGAALAASLSAGCGSIVEYADTSWVNVTANLAGMQSECGNMSFLSSRPDRDALIAGVARKGLFLSANASPSWANLGQGANSAVIINRPSSIVYDPDHPSTWWESGIYNGGGVYRTDDDGATFTQLGTASHCDLVSVGLNDPQRKTLLAGGHESGTVLYRSQDGGANWTNIGSLLPATAGDTSFPLVIDAQNFLVGTKASTGSGVFRSADGGATWTKVSNTPIRSQPLVASDHAIYWLLDNDAGLIKSTDQGLHWTQVTQGGVLSSNLSGVLELPAGRFAAVGGGYVLLSRDHGASWQRAGSPLPYSPQGIVYSSFRKAFYIWHFDCGTTPDPVPADGIMSQPFDFHTQ